MALIDYKEDLQTCHRCSVCKFIPLERLTGYDHASICPSVSRYNFHAYSGGGKLGIGTAMLEGKLDYSPKLLEVLYNCQLCGGCDVSCKYAMDMEVLEPLNEMRIDCVANGATLPILDQKIGALRNTGNLVGGAKNSRMEWTAPLEVKDATLKTSDIVYFAGCRTCFNKDMWHTAQSTIQLVQQAGLKIGTLPDESCCGVRAYQMGYKDDAIRQAKSVIESIKQIGCHTLVTGCAECYHAFKVLYGKLGLDIGAEVQHTSQLFATLIAEDQLALKTPVNMTVTYHDPCYLGRQGEDYIPWEGKRKPGHVILYDPPKEFRRGSGGVYGPPRDLLNQIPGLELVEMPRTKEYAWCCGAGGGVGETNPEFAQWTASQRIEEAALTGATAIVSACPGCESLFRKSISPSDHQLDVYDITELLIQATL